MFTLIVTKMSGHSGGVFVCLGIAHAFLASMPTLTISTMKRLPISNQILNYECFKDVSCA